MKTYKLCKGEIEGNYREIQIFPLNPELDRYLIHWDGFEIGVISTIDSRWLTETEQLKPVVNELGSFIDENGVT